MEISNYIGIFHFVWESHRTFHNIQESNSLTGISMWTRLFEFRIPVCEGRSIKMSSEATAECATTQSSIRRYNWGDGRQGCASGMSRRCCLPRHRVHVEHVIVAPIGYRPLSANYFSTKITYHHFSSKTRKNSN